MKTVILIDSGCDVFCGIARRFHIKVMPLHIIYLERDYINDTDILPEVVYQHFPDGIPATSTPGPQDVKDMVEEIKTEGYAHVLTFCISNGLSSTYNTVTSALGDEKDLTSFVLDTRNISFRAGILVVWAGMQLEEKKSLDELKEMLPGKVKDSKVFYYMNMLAYLCRGDRIGLTASVAGSVLNIKSTTSYNDDGICYTATKIRGVKRGLSRLLVEASSFAGGHLCLIALLNDQGQEVSSELRPRLIAHISEGCLIMEEAIIASLAVYTGLGLVGIGVLRLQRSLLETIFSFNSATVKPRRVLPTFLYICRV